MKKSILITLAVFLFDHAALAQEPIDVHGLYTVPNDGGLLDSISIYRAKYNTPNSFGVHALLEHAKEPAVLLVKTEGFDVAGREAIVEDLTALNLSVFYSPDKRLSFGASSPLYLSVDGMGQQMGTSLGDTRLSSTVSLIPNNENINVGLSATPYVAIPGFYEKQNLGLTGIAGGGVVAVSVGDNVYDISGNVGVEFTPSVEFYNLNGGERLITGLSTSYAFDDNVALRIEGTFRPTLSDNEYNWTDSPAEVLLSFRGHSGSYFDWTAGAAKGVSKGVSAADWRALAGVGVSFGSRNAHECATCQEYPAPEAQVITKTDVITEINTVYVIPSIFFDFDKASIKFPESEVTLNYIAYILKEVSNTEVNILGHTDDRGSVDYNIELSKRRIEAVINILSVKYGIDSSRLHPNAYGESLSSDCGIDENCHQIDRRVDFMIEEK
jgi:outer membrane protein OmpA-like peptidoglycan-associated protein